MPAIVTRRATVRSSPAKCMTLMWMNPRARITGEVWRARCAAVLWPATATNPWVNLILDLTRAASITSTMVPRPSRRLLAATSSVGTQTRCRTPRIRGGAFPLRICRCSRRGRLWRSAKTKYFLSRSTTSSSSTKRSTKTDSTSS